MSGNDEISLEEMLGPDPLGEEAESADEVLVDEAPSRAIQRRSRSYPVNGPNDTSGRIRAPGRPRKNTPERLNRLLRNIVEVPIASDAARRAGLSLSQLKYYLQKSLEGVSGDGFDVALPDDEENGTPDNTVRFHVIWEEKMLEGLGQAEKAAWALGNGYNEIQSHKGRVQYKIDPEKYALFLLLGDPIDERNPALWLRDELTDAPIPETIFKQDPDMLRWVLENRKPKEWGKRAVVDMNVTGGVLVVGVRAATSEALNELESTYRKEGRPNVVFDDSIEDAGDE